MVRGLGDSSWSGDTVSRADDNFVVGQGTKVMDFDLSPDGTGLSVEATRHRYCVCSGDWLSLAAAKFGLRRYMNSSVVSQSMWISGVTS